MGVHKRNIHFCLLLYNDFFLCVIQHEMFIFRTTLVNTVIVIILSTNVIQFYCVTSEFGVFFLSPFSLSHFSKFDLLFQKLEG